MRFKNDWELIRTFLTLNVYLSYFPWSSKGLIWHGTARFGRLGEIARADSATSNDWTRAGIALLLPRVKFSWCTHTYCSIWLVRFRGGHGIFFRKKTFSGNKNKTKENGSKLKKKGTKSRKRNNTQEKSNKISRKEVQDSQSSKLRMGQLPPFLPPPLWLPLVRFWWRLVPS